MRITNKLSIITSTIALSALSLTPAQASAPRETETISFESPAIVADTQAHLRFDRSPVGSIAAPAPLAPAPVPQSVPVPAPERSIPTPKATPVTSPVTPKAPEAPAPAVSGDGATIAAAAYAQLGVPQDCTALVSNALAAAGIHYHGWPVGYLSLGHVVSAASALPGDLIYYPNGGMGLPHIAVYVGNGMAVHGGWNGGTTALASAFIGSGATFIRV